MILRRKEASVVRGASERVISNDARESSRFSRDAKLFENVKKLGENVAIISERSAGCKTKAIVLFGLFRNEEK